MGVSIPMTPQAAPKIKSEPKLEVDIAMRKIENLMADPSCA